MNKGWVGARHSRGTYGAGGRYDQGKNQEQGPTGLMPKLLGKQQ